jgi:hypothetical protein
MTVRRVTTSYISDDIKIELIAAAVSTSTGSAPSWHEWDIDDVEIASLEIRGVSIPVDRFTPGQIAAIIGAFEDTVWDFD